MSGRRALGWLAFLGTAAAVLMLGALVGVDPSIGETVVVLASYIAGSIAMTVVER
jgi:uncharacterized membrane protein